MVAKFHENIVANVEGSGADLGGAEKHLKSDQDTRKKFQKLVGHVKSLALD
jgi:hypothetical protein